MHFFADFEKQYRALYEDNGFYERTERGYIAVSGADRFSWLQGMVSNDVMLLKNPERTSLSACVLDSTGHIQGEMEIVRMDANSLPNLSPSLQLAETEFLLLDLPRENLIKILDILNRLLIMEEVELRDVSAAMGSVSVRGKIVYFAPATDANRSALLDSGDLVEISPAVRELWRIEQGIPKYGAELDPTVIAPEAVGKSHLSLTKGCYVGQEIVARIDARGHTNRALTGLVIENGVVPKVGDKLFVQEEDRLRETGRITSVATFSPAAGGKPIALGYVRHEHRNVGDTVFAETDAGQASLRVSALPFAGMSA